MSVNKASLFRGAVQLVSGIGVSKVVNDVIANNTNIETRRDLLLVKIGSAVIGGMVADHGKTVVGDHLDGAAETWRKFRGEDTEEDAQTESV